MRVMVTYVESALFVSEDAPPALVEAVVGNSCGTRIELLELGELLQNPATHLNDIHHVLVAAGVSGAKEVLGLAMEYGFSVGILPLKRQGRFVRYLDLPGDRQAAINYGLQADALPMDIVLCNDRIMLFRASIGWIPMLDNFPGSQLQRLIRGLKNFFALRLREFLITPASGKTIRTAASGCMLVQRHTGDRVSDLTEYDSTLQDGAVGLVISSPISVSEYLLFLLQAIRPKQQRKLPRAIGHIKSAKIRIEPAQAVDVYVDGKLATTTPVVCKIIPKAVSVNVGPALRNTGGEVSKESQRIDNIPNERELKKSLSRSIPIFSYASEDRFKDLFSSLREDAKLRPAFITLMILSTMLATVGLYLNNSAVIIGAMILAPLMAPLVSASMGLLRAESALYWQSIKTIAVGIALALFTAALTTLAFPHKPITEEMLGRLNPTLLDLAVAIVSGVAAAYARSYREIAQNLAGVAIAVALVPPLAVAGIGLGRGDPYFFLQAFLLFSTNMVGIILAAMFTFRVLGFSPVVRGKRGVYTMLLLLALITVPLYIAYQQNVDRIVFENKLETDRYFVNGKYLQVRKVKASLHEGRLLLIVDLLAREPLTRDDLWRFKRKLQAQFEEPLIVQTNVIYFL